MDILIRFLMVFEAIVCLLLIGIVLLQRSKGGGAGLSFGGGAEAVFGAQVGNVLTRATVVLAVLFLANTTLLTVLRPQNRQARSVTERRAARSPESDPREAPLGVTDSADIERQIAELLETSGAPDGAAPDAQEAPVEDLPDAPTPPTGDEATDDTPATP